MEQIHVVIVILSVLLLLFIIFTIGFGSANTNCHKLRTKFWYAKEGRRNRQENPILYYTIPEVGTKSGLSYPNEIVSIQGPERVYTNGKLTSIVFPVISA